MRTRNVSHIILVLLLGASGRAFAQPHTVKVKGQALQYRLLRDGKPYFVKGVGGQNHLDLLVRSGGNSIRTWGAENAQTILDSAQKRGLTVTLGIWLGHSGEFDYHNPAAVKAQLDMCRDVVSRFKNHPALLAWSFGNEMEGNGDDPAVWKAIEDIAVMSKRLDPNHPTMTVLAELGGNKLKNLHRCCPSIDIVGVNSYGGAPTLGERYIKEGGTKPYILTEFGTPGPWESPKTSWEAPIELSSTEKAERYHLAYSKAVQAQKGLCLGSYAFLWGNKQEATATWFGMLLPGGVRLASVDALTRLWGGRRVVHPVPVIKSLTVSQSDQLKPGQTITARLRTGKLTTGTNVRWVLTSEASVRYAAGRDEPVPEGFASAVLASNARGAKVRLPPEGGGYRLFAYVLDKTGGAAVANVPLFVKAPFSTAKAVKPSLPLTVYGEAPGERYFQPTGWMGNTSALHLDLDSSKNPHSGKTCAEVRFEGQSSWAGVAWQYPADDWGTKPESLDLTGAKQLSFWLRGESGGEKVKVEFGILKKDKRFFETASRTVELELTQDWKQVVIDLKDLDLSQIKTGFVFTVEGRGAPVRFFFDDVEYR